jgi:hypothetical protein
VDDYAIPVCEQAIGDYRQRHGINDPIVEIDWPDVYRRKGK